MREYLGGDSGEYHVVVAEAPDECQHAMEPSNLLCVVLCVGRIVVRLVGLTGGPWVMVSMTATLSGDVDTLTAVTSPATYAGAVVGVATAVLTAPPVALPQVRLPSDGHEDVAVFVAHGSGDTLVRGAVRSVVRMCAK